MRYRVGYWLVLIILGSVCASIIAGSSAQSQSLEKLGEREFGSSLKQSPTDFRAANRRRKRGDDDEDVVRIDTDLVVCDVLVLDKQGRTVGSLKMDDFVVKEDGVAQEVGSFSLGNSAAIPRSIVLIIDYSGSQLPYIKTSIEAAKTLVDKLNPRDRMAIVTDDVKLLVGFTRDKALLKEKLEFLKLSALAGKVGRSEQYDALMATLNEIFSEADLRPIIIFQTDGDELGALKGGYRSSNSFLPEAQVKTFGFQDILTAAERSRATIYSIIPGVRYIGLSQDEQLKRARIDAAQREAAYVEVGKALKAPVTYHGERSESLMKAHVTVSLRLQTALMGLAKYTGGWADYLEQPDQANDVYSRILSSINSRYIVGYYPSNRTHDGKRRKVSLEVRGHSDYVIWGRKTYFAPDPEP